MKKRTITDAERIRFIVRHSYLSYVSNQPENQYHVFQWKGNLCDAIDADIRAEKKKARKR